MSEPTQTLVRRTAGWPAVLLAGIATFAAGLVVLSNIGGWGVAIAALYVIWTVWILRQKIVLELDDNALTVRLHNRSRRIPYSDIALSLIHISEPTRLHKVSRMPSSA